MDLWTWIVKRCGKSHQTGPSQFDPNHNGNRDIGANQNDAQTNGNPLMVRKLFNMYYCFSKNEGIQLASKILGRPTNHKKFAEQ